MNSLLALMGRAEDYHERESERALTDSRVNLTEHGTDRDRLIRQRAPLRHATVWSGTSGGGGYSC